MNPFDLLKAVKQKKNPFRELTNDERKKQRKEENEVKEGITSLGRLCADILLDQRYKEYADLYKDIEKKVIDVMIDCDEPDRDKYFLKMREYQLKLRWFRNFLRMPHDFVERSEEINRTIAK